MRYLEPREILLIHAYVIDASGGRHGVHDAGLLASALERPKAAFGGADMFAGPFAKAAAYLQAFATYHAFTDGNKRTAFAAAVRFIEKNGYRLDADPLEAAQFVVDVVEQKFDIPRIASWIQDRSTPAA